MRRSVKTTLYFIIVLCILAASKNASADLEWSQGKQQNLDAAPLDIASSTDGYYVYILHAGEVAVYSILDNKVIVRIPVDKTFDKISYSARVNTLFVSSRSSRAIRSIQLETVQKFSLSGLAIKGSVNAPVTIAVFSDYQ